MIKNNKFIKPQIKSLKIEIQQDYHKNYNNKLYQ